MPKPKHTKMQPVVSPKEGDFPAKVLQSKKNDEADEWLTRNQATDMLSCSAQTLANYERKGELNPRRSYRADARGATHLVLVYSPQELSKLAAKMHRNVISPRTAGELAGRAYELFDEGSPERLIVRELRMTPDAIRELRDKWLDGGGADLVISPMAKEALTKAIGPFKTVTELVDTAALLKELLERFLGAFQNHNELAERLTTLKQERFSVEVPDAPRSEHSSD